MSAQRLRRAVERYRRERQTDHARSNARERQGNEAFPVALRHWSGFGHFRVAVRHASHQSHLSHSDIAAKSYDGDDEEQNCKRHEYPSDGQGSLALTAFAFGFRIFHHIVQLSDAATLSNPKPCSARSTAKSTKRYSTE